jgi:hypothetical protein
LNSSRSTNYYMLTCEKPTRSHNPRRSRHFHQHQQSDDAKRMFVPHARQQVTVAYRSRKPFRGRQGLSDGEDSPCARGLPHGIVGIRSGGYALLDMFCRLSSSRVLPSQDSGGDADIEVKGFPWSAAVSNILSPIPGRPRCVTEKSLCTESTDASWRCLAHAVRPPFAPYNA